MNWWQYMLLIVFTYLVMHFVFLWSTTAENWSAGTPDHSYDVKMKF